MIALACCWWTRAVWRDLFQSRSEGEGGDTDESWTPGMFLCCFLLFVTMHTAYRTENYGEDELTPSRHVTSRVTSVTASTHRPQQQQQRSQQSMVSPLGLFFYSSPIFLVLATTISSTTSTSMTTTHQHQHFSWHPKPLNVLKWQWQQQQHWPLVSFFFLVFIIIFTNFLSGSFNALKRRWQQQQQQ